MGYVYYNEEEVHWQIKNTPEEIEVFGDGPPGIRKRFFYADMEKDRTVLQKRITAAADGSSSEAKREKNWERTSIMKSVSRLAQQRKQNFSESAIQVSDGKLDKGSG